MDILLKSDEALEERQMASILLKQFVKAHWYKGSLEFTPPLVADNIKNKIRSALPEGLEDVYSKIRSACSSILALIAVTDYPHDWPDMCDGTLLKIEYGGEAICEGVITYISDFYMFASVYQITIASKIVYPVLYNIVESHEVCILSFDNIYILHLWNFRNILLHSEEEQHSYSLGMWNIIV